MKFIITESQLKTIVKHIKEEDLSMGGDFELIKSVEVISQKQVQKLSKYIFVVKITFDIIDTQQSFYEDQEPKRTEVTATTEWIVYGKRYNTSLGKPAGHHEVLFKVLNVETSSNDDKQLSRIFQTESLKQFIKEIYHTPLYFYSNMVKNQDMVNSFTNASEASYEKLHSLFQGSGYPNGSKTHPWGDINQHPQWVNFYERMKNKQPKKNRWTSSNSWEVKNEDTMKLQDIINEMAGKGPKKGSPEEMVEFLKLFPVDDTALVLAAQIYEDVAKYYSEDIRPTDKTYYYSTNEKCIESYSVEIDFRPSNNSTGIGYAEEQYIQVKYLNKDSREFQNNPRLDNRLLKWLYNIIKHECSHFYLKQKDVPACLYHTHEKGMKKYYEDPQEIALHSREIFDEFEEQFPNWRTTSLETIINRLTFRIKNLPRHTSIGAPFGGGIQKKYLNHILNVYIKPYLETPAS